MATVRELYGNFLLPLIDIASKCLKTDDSIHFIECLNKLGDTECIENHRHITSSEYIDVMSLLTTTRNEMNKILEHMESINHDHEHKDPFLPLNRAHKLIGILEDKDLTLHNRINTTNLSVTEYATQYISESDKIIDHYFPIDGICFKPTSIHVHHKVYNLIDELRAINPTVAGSVIDVLIKQIIRNNKHENMRITQYHESHINKERLVDKIFDDSNDHYKFMSALRMYYKKQIIRYKHNINESNMHDVYKIVSNISKSVYKHLMNIISEVIPIQDNADTKPELFHRIHGEPDIVCDNTCIEIKCINRCTDAIKQYIHKTKFQLIMYSSLLMHKGIKINELIIFDINNGLIHKANVRDITEEMYMKFIPDVFSRYPPKK